MHARLIVLAGPSGSGKSRLAADLGLPVLQLDDFYKAGDDPTLPRIGDGPNAGLVDWDHPDSWLIDDALAAVEELCRTGRTRVPDYVISANAAVGEKVLDLDGAPVFVAEGIFAAEIVPAARQRGRLAAAYCLRQHPLLTFWRRLSRDLREHRKPPLVLLRRGLALMRAQHKVVRHAEALGCAAVTGEEARTRIADLVASAGPPA